jgi:hypothetical protein
MRLFAVRRVGCRRREGFEALAFVSHGRHNVCGFWGLSRTIFFPFPFPLVFFFCRDGISLRGRGDRVGSILSKSTR